MPFFAKEVTTEKAEDVTGEVGFVTSVMPESEFETRAAKLAVIQKIRVK